MDLFDIPSLRPWIHDTVQYIYLLQRGEDLLPHLVVSPRLARLSHLDCASHTVPRNLRSLVTSVLVLGLLAE